VSIFLSRHPAEEREMFQRTESREIYLLRILHPASCPSKLRNKIFFTKTKVEGINIKGG
jgi:hypothetical protein